MSKINIDFQILTTYDPKFVLVVDTSAWGSIDGFPSIIEVTLPGREDAIVHFFDKHKVNAFNSHNLMNNCFDCDPADNIDLPDGIYTITVKGSPDKFYKTRYFLKTDRTRRELDEFIVSFNTKYELASQELLNKIQKINFYLEAAEANTRLGNFKEAQELLLRTKRSINKLKYYK